MTESSPAGSLGDDVPHCLDDRRECIIIGMLGGPGSGKGTQCRLLSKKFDLEHISIGDVLRREISRPGSQHAEIIRENMALGRVGPKEITVAILKGYITEASEGGKRNFILDGKFRAY
jgi:UMP-CMP kinase